MIYRSATSRQARASLGRTPDLMWASMSDRGASFAALSASQMLSCGRCGMGASGWDYVTTYRGELASSLAALHVELFDGGESYFREELGEWDLPQPATLQELRSEPYAEFMEENGTHSILDMPSMEWITPLTSQETQQAFGTDRPTRADWDRVAGASAEGVWHLVRDTWSGRCVVLFTDEGPDAVAFWGASGD